MNLLLVTHDNQTTLVAFYITLPHTSSKHSTVTQIYTMYILKGVVARLGKCDFGKLHCPRREPRFYR